VFIQLSKNCADAIRLDYAFDRLILLTFLLLGTPLPTSPPPSISEFIELGMFWPAKSRA